MDCRRPFLNLVLALPCLSACAEQELPAPTANPLSAIARLVEQRLDCQALESSARYTAPYEVGDSTKEGR
jgi:hypothetical protein